MLLAMAALLPGALMAQQSAIVLPDAPGRGERFADSNPQTGIGSISVLEIVCTESIISNSGFTASR